MRLITRGWGHCRNREEWGEKWTWPIVSSSASFLIRTENGLLYVTIRPSDQCHLILLDPDQAGFWRSYPILKQTLKCTKFHIKYLSKWRKGFVVDRCSHPIATTKEWWRPSRCQVTPAPPFSTAFKTRAHDCGSGNTTIAVHNTTVLQIIPGTLWCTVLCAGHGSLALDSFMNQEASILGVKRLPMSSKLTCQKHPLISWFTWR